MILVFGNCFLSMTSLWDLFLDDLFLLSLQKCQQNKSSISEGLSQDEQKSLSRAFSSSLSTVLTEDECSCQTVDSSISKVKFSPEFSKNSDQSLVPPKTTTYFNNHSKKPHLTTETNEEKSLETSEYTDALEYIYSDYGNSSDSTDMSDTDMIYKDPDNNYDDLSDDRTSSRNSSNSSFSISSHALMKNSNNCVKSDMQIVDESIIYRNVGTVIARVMSSDKISEASTDSKGISSTTLPDYGIVCRYCLKRKPFVSSLHTSNISLNLATEIHNVSMSPFEMETIENNDILRHNSTEFFVCVVAAIERLISLWLRHLDHR